jgi:hypothetical protein
MEHNYKLLVEREWDFNSVINLDVDIYKGDRWEK